MHFFKFFCIGLLVFLSWGCAQEETPVGETPGKETPPAPEEAAGESEDRGPLHAVKPVELSPEDQKKAQRAPQGMVFVKGGCFFMGNDYAQEDERPEHEVCLDDFFMDRYEVTQARWTQVMGFNPSKFIGKDRPVEQVNYYDVQEFIEKSDRPCRLPTEAEWEYAARGGVNTRYYWGNLMDDAYAWYEDNSDGKTHPVGKKKPNQYGLHDILGNVWEWTHDWYENFYQVRSPRNPQGPATGEYKVIRGGAFDSSAGALRVTNRTWLHPKNRVFPKVTTYGQIINEVYNFIGFRCVVSYSEVPPPDTPQTEPPSKQPEEPQEL